MRWCAILKVHTLPDPIPTAIVALVLGVPDLTTTLPPHLLNLSAASLTVRTHTSPDAHLLQL
jgi:hypothetical protein